MNLRQIGLWASAMAGLLLAACAGAATTTSPSTTPEPIPSPTRVVNTEGVNICSDFPAIANLTRQPIPANSPFYPITADDYTLGPDTAAITFIEYGDFQ